MCKKGGKTYQVVAGERHGGTTKVLPVQGSKTTERRSTVALVLSPLSLSLLCRSDLWSLLSLLSIMCGLISF